MTKHRHFEIITPNGQSAMVHGDPNMPQETAAALAKMIDLASEQFGGNEKHCDDYIDDPSQPECLRNFLAYKRMPAIDQARAYGRGEMCPDLYATHEGKRVRVMMASRFGDVGITANLFADRGYTDRVFVEQLSDFSKEP